MPTPLSRTPTTTSRPSSLAVDLDSAARLGVLGGVVQQIGKNLRHPRRVGVQKNGLSGNAIDQLHGRPNRSADGWFPPHYLSPPRVRPVLAKLDLVARDAADVEQVVHQPSHLPHLPLDDAVRFVGESFPAGRQGAGLPAQFRIGASGLRSSCASVARNCSLRRSASSRACSACHCWVTSRVKQRV